MKENLNFLIYFYLDFEIFSFFIFKQFFSHNSLIIKNLSKFFQDNFVFNFQNNENKKDKKSYS